VKEKTIRSLLKEKIEKLLKEGIKTYCYSCKKEMDEIELRNAKQVCSNCFDMIKKAKELEADLRVVKDELERAKRKIEIVMKIGKARGEFQDRFVQLFKEIYGEEEWEKFVAKYFEKYGKLKNEAKM
jgi:phenylalanyl-tRNA synthetase alpha subunit